MGTKAELRKELMELRRERDSLKSAFDNYIAEKTRYDLAFIESEEKYRMLIENLNEIIYTLDENAIVTYISPNIETISGYTPSEVIGKSFVDFVHPEDIKGRREQFRKILSGHIDPSEYRMLTKEGRTVWMRTRARPLVRNDRLIGIQGVLTEITDLKETEKRLNTLMSQTPAIIYSYIISDNEINITYVNENVRNILGYSPEELIGNTRLWFGSIHPDDSAISENTIRSNKEIRDSVSEYRVRDKKGFYHWLYDKQKVNKIEGGDIEVIGASWDITARKEAEQELTRQKQFFEQLFMQSSVSIQILDHEGWCERVNPKLSEIFGVEPKDIEGRNYNIFMDKAVIEGGIIPHLEKVFNEGKTQEWEVFFDLGVAADSQNIRVKEKKKVWYNNWAFPIFDENGELSNVIIQHHDITERKIAEQELISAKERAEENNRLKSVFLANLSHD